jgi:heptosyltransferase I
LKILIVKLSSLGDVLHTLPVVHDIRQALPNAQIDWVVEGAFAGVLRRCEGINRVITCDLRTWRKAPFSSATRTAWRACKAALQLESYDAVIDLQGLTKSAWVAWMARLAPAGKRFAMANRTDGSGYEAPTRWVADVAIRLQPRVHAIQRGREVCAQALGYASTDFDGFHPSFGLIAGVNIASLAINNVAKISQNPCIVFAHGTSREDKLWPVSHWVELGQRLNELGFTVALAHGSALEEARSQQIAQQLPNAVVWPRLGLEALLDALGGSAGVIGVDSGLSHMAVALNLPHVQIYNFDTAWRTGPVTIAGQASSARQVSVYAQPTPSVEVVWQAWQSVGGLPTISA